MQGWEVGRLLPDLSATKQSWLTGRGRGLDSRSARASTMHFITCRQKDGLTTRFTEASHRSMRRQKQSTYLDSSNLKASVIQRHQICWESLCASNTQQIPHADLVFFIPSSPLCQPKSLNAAWPYFRTSPSTSFYYLLLVFDSFCP